MILIDKITNGARVQPSRSLTEQEKPTIIAAWSDASHYIYFQPGDETSPEWADFEASQTVSSSAGDLNVAQVSKYIRVAQDLLYDIYRLNAEAGITSSNGDQLERDYEDVLRAIERGMFGLALMRLSALPDTGLLYNGQDLKAHWTTLITECKNANSIS